MIGSIATKKKKEREKELKSRREIGPQQRD
jgi:hypothetical protein